MGVTRSRDEPSGAQAMAARLSASVPSWMLGIARFAYRAATPHLWPARIAHMRARKRRLAGERASLDWDRSPEAKQLARGIYWMGHPLVARRLNIKASGSPDADAYGRLQQLLEAQGWGFPVSRALSLGCGHGALERRLASAGFAARYDAIDLAPQAIAEARRLADDAGLQNIHYSVGDLEQVDLPAGAFDVVLAHQSAHHVEDLDRLFATVSRALRPGGVFHLHEFVGPDRFQWTDAQLHHMNAFVGALPARYLRLPSGEPRPNKLRPTIADMIAIDPTEAISSSAILNAVGRHFRILEIRELGGALLHEGLGGIGQNFDPQAPEDVAHLDAFFALEDRLMSQGVIASDFVTVTAMRE